MHESPSQPRIGMLERYLRRRDSLLAKAIARVSPKTGTEYRNSKTKRVFELCVTMPAAIAAVPLILALGAAAKFEDGGPMFFMQERVGQGGRPVRIIKIRTMTEGAEEDAVGIERARHINPEDDPRNTILGKRIRTYELDELPQLFQVLSGSLSLIDTRCITPQAIETMQAEHPATFDEWYHSYLAGRPWIMSLNSAMNEHRKDVGQRYYYDTLYARNASLGLDLFILYKTAQRLAHAWRDKLFKSNGAVLPKVAA